MKKYRVVGGKINVGDWVEVSEEALASVQAQLNWEIKNPVQVKHREDIAFTLDLSHCPSPQGYTDGRSFNEDLIKVEIVTSWAQQPTPREPWQIRRDENLRRVFS